MRASFALRLLLVGLSLLAFGCLHPPAATPVAPHDCGGVPHGACLENRPYACDDGKPVANPQRCGCPAGQTALGAECAPVPSCPDGTENGVCSANRPFACLNGTLIVKSSECGCPGGFTPADNDDCADARTEKNAQLERRIHDRVNVQRTNAGLSPLSWNGQLAAVARDHSADMHARGYFEHINPEGEAPADRYARHNYACLVSTGPNAYLTSGENLFLAWLFDAPADSRLPGVRQEYRSVDALANATVAGWMASPLHRGNLLTPEWRSEGIGVYIGPDHRVLVTENFC